MNKLKRNSEMNAEINFPTEHPDEKPVKPNSSLIKVLLWLAVLLFVPQILMFLGLGIFYGVQDAGFSDEALDAKMTSVLTLLVMTLIAPIMTIPLLNAATQASNWRERFDFWALKPVIAKILFIALGVGFMFWGVTSLVGDWLNIPIEQFMLDVKAASDSFIAVILVIVTVCFVVPVMEELIFRGWLYSKIAQTKLGNIGALISTSIIFTIIHTQYDNMITFFILLLLGLVLAFTRYKTGNVSYSIAIHILFNSLGVIVMFFFM
jgi:membrane protease YdiL (CAAX protease family)